LTDDARAHDALDEALDRLVRGEPAHAPEGLDPLVQTARAAREAFVLAVPEEVARAHIAAMTGAATLERRRPRHRVAMVLIAAAITAILLGGAAVSASASALPGELLYPVKRAVERIELIIHHDPASQTRLHLQFAQRRLTELSALQAQASDGKDVNIGAAISAYRSEVAAAQSALAADAASSGYQQLAASVDGQLLRHLAVLNALKYNAQPGPAQVAILNAIARVDQAQQSISNAPDTKALKPKSRGKPHKPRPSPSGTRGR